MSSRRTGDSAAREMPPPGSNVAIAAGVVCGRDVHGSGQLHGPA